MTNPLRQLQELGQSVWLDDIDREQLRSGLFGRLIKEKCFRACLSHLYCFANRLHISACVTER